MPLKLLQWNLHCGRESIREVFELGKIYVCDYLDPIGNEVECLIVEAESRDEAIKKAIQELKALDIPKRYLINLEVM